MIIIIIMMIMEICMIIIILVIIMELRRGVITDRAEEMQCATEPSARGSRYDHAIMPWLLVRKLAFGSFGSSLTQTDGW